MSRRNSRPEKLKRKAAREALQAERDARAYLVQSLFEKEPGS